MFYSLDVEASSTSPFSGELLTVGIVAVDSNGYIYNTLTFYMRLDVRLSKEWYNPELPTHNETLKWWRDQAEDVRGEAYENRHLTRTSEREVCDELTAYFVQTCPDKNERFLVANPIAYDKPWIDKMFARQDLEVPYHYRSLCLRSMKFGLDPQPIFGSDRTTNLPGNAHHALSDAIAQAKDLQDMIHVKRERHHVR
jgi:hypothetical protein